VVCAYCLGISAQRQEKTTKDLSRSNVPASIRTGHHAHVRVARHLRAPSVPSHGAFGPPKGPWAHGLDPARLPHRPQRAFTRGLWPDQRPMGPWTRPGPTASPSRAQPHTEPAELGLEPNRTAGLTGTALDLYSRGAGFDTWQRHQSTSVMKVIPFLRRSTMKMLGIIFIMLLRHRFLPNPFQFIMNPEKTFRPLFPKGNFNLAYVSRKQRPVEACRLLGCYAVWLL
jgi:hypothetical protein